MVSTDQKCPSSKEQSKRSPRQFQGSVLAIAYSLPPLTSSGAIRNYKILENIRSQNWQVHLLTSRPSQADFSRDSELFQASSISRAARLNILQLLLDFRDACFRNRATIERNEPTANVEEQNGKSKKGVWQSIKDFISDLLEMPDARIGWFPASVWQGARVMRREKPRVIYAVGKPWTAFLVGYALKFWFRKPLVIDYMDPWGSNPWKKQKGFLLDRIDLALEKFLLRKSDLVIANTDELAEDFVQRFQVPREKVRVITCGVDPEDFRDISPLDSGGNERFTVTHTGSFYAKRTPVSFLLAVQRLFETKQLDPSQIHIQFVGSCDLRDPELTRLLSDHRFKTCLTWKEWVPHAEVMKVICASDLLLLVQPDTTLQIPAKLYEYAYTRKRVLALCDPQGAVDSMIKREQWGWTVETRDIEAISKCLFDAFEIHQKTGTCSAEGDPARLERYCVSDLAGRLEQVFDLVSDQ
ncbi:MAG: glycosyltransferase [Pirellulaceae bacterium]|nr:glycosyltransferase [Pirellulaceae bacterium]